MKAIDLILISDAKTPNLKNLTDQAIATAGDGVNIIVVESNRSCCYDRATTIYPDSRFNYNAYLNWAPLPVMQIIFFRE